MPKVVVVALYTFAGGIPSHMVALYTLAGGIPPEA